MLDENKDQSAWEAKQEMDKDAIHLRNMVLPATIAGLISCGVLLVILLRLL